MRSIDPRALRLALVRTVNTGGLSLVMVYMGIYMVSSRGLSLAQYGLIILCTSVVQSWAQGAAGLISDRIGRRPVMTTALIIRSIVIVGLGAWVSIDAPIVLIAATLLVSSSLRGAFEPVAYAFVADVVRPDQRVFAFGMQRMGTNLGWAVGPALGGALLESIDYGTVFYCAAPALLVSAFLVHRLVEPEKSNAPSSIDNNNNSNNISSSRSSRSVIGAVVTAMSQPVTALFLIGVFFFAVSHLQMFTTLSVYAKETLALSEAEIGRTYTVNALCVLALQMAAVAIIGHLGATVSLIGGSLIFSGSFFAFGQADGFNGVAIAIAILTLGEILITPAQQAVVAELSSSDAYGRAFGVMGTMTMLGVAVGPLIGGLAFDSIGDHGVAMWGLLAGLPAMMVLAFSAFAVARKRQVHNDQVHNE